MTDLQTDSNDEPSDDGLFDVDAAGDLNQTHYNEELCLQVQPEQAGQRLDAFLALGLSQYSRTRIQQWITAGRVSLFDAIITKGSQAVTAGQTYQVRIPEPQTIETWQPQPMDLSVVFEDDELIVINKPANLVVHPAAGHWSGTLLNGLLHQWPDLQSVPRAGIVHRLDRDTSGLMVVAKTLTAQTSLVRQLQSKSVFRHYLAVCWHRSALGRANQSGLMSGRVDAPIGRHPNDRQRMAIVNGERGKPATTHFKVLGTGQIEGQAVRLLACQLETGRTHQIRVHLQSIGYPIVGDPIYHQGAPRQMKPSIQRQALHAKTLGLLKPSTGQAMTFDQGPPADFMVLLTEAGLPTQ